MKRTYLTPRTATLTVAYTHIMEGTTVSLGGDDHDIIGGEGGGEGTDINWAPDYREDNDELW